MPSPTLIRAIDVAPLDILLHAPFGISGGAQATANNVLLSIELGDGTRGYGEAAPLPPYNGETQAAALAALRRAREWFVGAEARDWRQLAMEFRTRTIVRSGSAQCAFETALLDAVMRHDHIPMWRYFGGHTADSGQVRSTSSGQAHSTDSAQPSTGLETDMTVTTGSVDEAAIAARAICKRGIRMIKVKVGGAHPAGSGQAGGAALDLARIAAIRDVAPDSPLILDGNAGISREVARELVQGLKTREIAPALLEQWLARDDLDGMRALHEESGWPVAADEAVSTAEDVRQIADARAAQFVNIKLMKAGIVAALDVASAARERGLGLMIGGNVESILAMTVSACFAMGLGGFQFADLDTPLFLAENPFDGGYGLEGGRITLDHITAGHGVVPKR